MTTQTEMFGSPVAMARSKFYRELVDGSICPVCDRHGQLYKRSLLGVMAAGVVWLDRESKRGERWVHIRSAPRWLLNNGGSLQTTRHWGLVEQRENTNVATNSSGEWRTTALGSSFAAGVTRVSRYAWTYHAECERVSGPLVGVVDVLGDRFNYRALREGRYDESHLA